MPELKDLKVGDEIAVTEVGGRLTVNKVTKVTKKFVEDSSGWRWSLDGRVFRRVVPSSPRAEVATDDHRKAVADKQLRGKCGDVLNDLADMVYRDTDLARRVLQALEGIDAS